MIDALLARFPVSARVAGAARQAHARVAALPARTASDARSRVLHAFAQVAPTQDELAGTTGYGYGDAARAQYEALLAAVLGAERVLARLSLVSGTHAILTALAACTPAGGRIVAATGRPYDTLHNAIARAPYALTQRGIRYDEVALHVAGGVDHAALAAAVRTGVDVVFVQRSRGYAPRRSLSARACGEVAATVRAIAPEAVVLVDNCYGELVEAEEPTHYGADLIAGSLIKNLGGSLAPGGAYVAGRTGLIERVAAHHYAPGLGAAVGPTLGFGRAFVQGLFLAPLIIDECLAGLDFAAALFAEFGYAVEPAPGGPRYDIVQAIRLGDPARLVAFARGLQRAMPLDARFAPEPGPVPGYPDPVIMAGGAFVQGSTLELSCDAPLREPYEVYLQGGTVRDHGVLGAILAAESLEQESLLPAEKAATMRNTAG